MREEFIPGAGGLQNARTLQQGMHQIEASERQLRILLHRYKTEKRDSLKAEIAGECIFLSNAFSDVCEAGLSRDRIESMLILNSLDLINVRVNLLLEEAENAVSGVVL